MVGKWSEIQVLPTRMWEEVFGCVWKDPKWKPDLVVTGFLDHSHGFRNEISTLAVKLYVACGGVYYMLIKVDPSKGQVQMAMNHPLWRSLWIGF